MVTSGSATANAWESIGEGVFDEFNGDQAPNNPARTSDVG